MILGCKEWNEKSDIWSLACILVELYTGELLFAVHEDLEHLAIIEKIIGPLSRWMIELATDGDEEKGTFRNILMPQSPGNGQ